ncbi:MAG TPA: LysR family transcriptional regulator [Blastocatellia bacterium]|jgi:DNA-binding transcriptional LysR family regulator|nr:LysR family transcriptional regulator [Blastocatellia bacterium]
MEFWQLEVFAAVAEEKSFSRAGRRMGRTQPAISSAVKLLEDELGERLFDRLGKSIRLTAAGELLMEYAKRMVRLRDEARLAMGELRGLSRGRISLGANETTCLYLLPDVLSSFKQAYPQVQVDIQRAISRNITEKVVEGSLDFGIVTLPVRDPRLETITIHKDEMALIVGPGHPLASRRSVNMSELEGEPFILHKIGTTTRERMAKHFGDGGVSLKVGMELASIETIKRFVSIGMGISIVPRLCIEKEVAEGSLRTVELKNARFQRHLGLVYHKERYLSQAARAFLALITGSGQAALRAKGKSSRAGGANKNA